jgi:hypothetical protein
MGDKHIPIKKGNAIQKSYWNKNLDHMHLSVRREIQRNKQPTQILP